MPFCIYAVKLIKVTVYMAKIKICIVCMLLFLHGNLNIYTIFIDDNNFWRNNTLIYETILSFNYKSFSFHLFLILLKKFEWSP